MLLRTTSQISAVAILIACSGTITHAGAPAVEIGAPSMAADSGGTNFRSSRWIAERGVVSNTGDTIATVTDLIIDRGTGRIDYLVLTTDTTFGLGGRAVLVPYADFRWDPAGKDRYVLASTAEQLKSLPEYTPKSWSELKQTSAGNEDALHRRLASDAAAPSDPYAGGLTAAKKMHIEGKIRSVDRVQTSTFGEQAQVTVEAADGSTKNVTLGPSWFVNSSGAAPLRGDKVVIDALELPRDPDQLFAAVETRIGDRSLKLRDTNGGAAWTKGTVESDGQTYSNSYSRSVLASSLYGAKVDCRGNECGKVADLVVESQSGTIAFLSIDPNQNFLGIGDTKRLVPWSVASFALNGTVRLDASKEMVLASSETPSNADAMNSGNQFERAYKAYETKAPRYDRRRGGDAPGALNDAPGVRSNGTPDSRADNRTDDNAGGWGRHGAVLSGIERGSVRTITGTVVSVAETSVERGTQPARVVTVKLANGTEEAVILGPEWYLAKQKMQCSAGDPVTFQAVRTQINSKPHWIARSMKHKDVQMPLIGDDNEPAWSRK
ncbi:MAG: PRC-barrel domain-containing protein [Phycisphaerales bacterium]|nr:PRC-barrel domain-containing protein [Phycisphaerales bacterium]